METQPETSEKIESGRKKVRKKSKARKALRRLKIQLYSPESDAKNQLVGEQNGDTFVTSDGPVGNGAPVPRGSEAEETARSDSATLLDVEELAREFCRATRKVKQLKKSQHELEQTRDRLLVRSMLLSHIAHTIA